MPEERRRFDGYVAAPDLVEVGRVFFIGLDRMVIRKRFESKGEWTAERGLMSKKHLQGERVSGSITVGTRGPIEAEVDWDGSEGPPDGCKFFYGVDYI
jgi:hypothetical protein